MAVPGQTGRGHAVGSYARRAMSELRRNDGPDGADNPAEVPAKPDRPGERPNVEIRSADQNPDWPVDRRKVTAAQRYYSDLVKQAGDAPPLGDTDVVYVKDWASGESLDHKYPHIAGGKDRHTPEVRRSPYADPPPGFGRNNSDLEARTVQRAEDVDRTTRFSELEPGRRRSRGPWDQIAAKSDEVIEKAQDVSDGIANLFDPPRPTGSFAGSAPDTPAHITNPYAGHQHHVGDTVATVAALTFIGVDLGRKLRDKINERKDRNAGHG